MQAEIIESYRAHRRDLRIPARCALQWVRSALAIEAWATRVGFEWTTDRAQRQTASWIQGGFDLRAEIIDEPDGWWTSGVDCIGKFIPKWQPGAIRHHHAGRRDCEWFLPADPDYGKQAYRRACEYGDWWWYVGVRVSASRAGVELAKSALCGIEYDLRGLDLNHFREIVFDLTGDAVHDANEAVRKLCTCKEAA